MRAESLVRRKVDAFVLDLAAIQEVRGNDERASVG
jgi:hypothetical protein